MGGLEVVEWVLLRLRGRLGRDLGTRAKIDGSALICFPTRRHSKEDRVLASETAGTGQTSAGAWSIDRRRRSWEGDKGTTGPADSPGQRALEAKTGVRSDADRRRVDDVRTSPSQRSRRE